MLKGEFETVAPIMSNDPPMKKSLKYPLGRKIALVTLPHDTSAAMHSLALECT
jgi:hypothetical protein